MVWLGCVKGRCDSRRHAQGKCNEGYGSIAMDKVAPCKVCEVLEESGCMKDVTTATGCAVSRTRARSLSFTLNAVAFKSYIHSLGILKLSRSW